MAAELKGPYKVKVTVTEIRGEHKCWLGHKVGDSWILADGLTPANFCQSAFGAVYPAVNLLRNGGSFWFSTDKDVVAASCPDPAVMVQFEVRRLPRD